MSEKDSKAKKYKGKVFDFIPSLGKGYIKSADKIYPVHISSLQNGEMFEDGQQVSFEVRTMSDGHEKVSFVNIEKR